MVRKRSTRSSRSRSKRAMNAAIPRTRREFDSFLDAHHAFFVAKTQGLTRREAALAEEIRESTLEKWTPGAWKKRGKEFYANPNKLISPLVVQTEKGARQIVVHNPREATEVSFHHIAIHKAFDGDPRALAKFRGKKNPTTGELYETDIKELRRRDDAGLLNPKTIYWFGRRR